jgi:putative transferase (TIGR04331 family)
LPMKSRFLITTADERSWKLDQPVLFLGEWCRLYSRRHIWEKLDEKVAAPFGLEPERKKSLFELAIELEKQLFPSVCNALNHHHKLKYSHRFWKIVLGHWLRRFIFVVINRYSTIVQCLKEHKINGTIGFSKGIYNLATLDSNSFGLACNDDYWSNVLYLRILGLLGSADFPVKYIDTLNEKGFMSSSHTPENSRSIKRRIFEPVKQVIKTAFPLLRSESDAVIVNSYLPFIKEKLLYLALGQAPQIYSVQELDLDEEPDRNIRAKLIEANSTMTNDRLANILNMLVFELMPVCFLEGFNSLMKQANQLKWPKRPKFIFTSNNFDTDEIFKIWTASKAEFGCLYFTGQHGDAYSRVFDNPRIEEETADKFITWGWTDGLPQHTPAFLFKTSGKKRKYDQEGGLLLIEVLVGHRYDLWDETTEFAEYWNDQIELVQLLGNEVNKRLTIRLHPGCQDMRWSEVQRWHDFDPDLSLELGKKTIKDLIGKSRLVIHSYNSTGIFETLSQGIPTIAFWQNELDDLRESVKPYYQALVDVGIVHLSPSSAAKKINEIWDNVETWWEEPEVKRARECFCDRFARTKDHPVRFLKNLLLEPIADGVKHDI